MLEKILSNLLSNAFKFTPEGGRVTVSTYLRRAIQLNPSWKSDCVEITVQDTGAGIPADQLDRVFDRFYQVDASQTREHEGSGIGLALVKELVELQHGAVRVQSETGRGTTFTVLLPLGRSHLKDDEIADVPDNVEAMAPAAGIAAAGGIAAESTGSAGMASRSHDKPLVLVIEDNADVRQYVRDNLPSTYHVVEAADGAEGVDRAREIVPDLIVSDVMMPKKDGYEVCRDLKNDEKTSHIPIILLTAKAASGDKIEGLETGADDYLIKPFDVRELIARIRNLIEVRRKLRERFSVGTVLKPGEIAIASLDDAFLQRVIAVVEKNMANEGFSVEDLGREVGMSRVQIHRKLTALTNQSAGEFIRYMRLHRAMDMLKKDAGTVSEIAYSVGFGSPAYFTKCFHEQFGLTPLEVRKSAHWNPSSNPSS
jgi:DNA-binding response OmpR family regulator